MSMTLDLLGDRSLKYRKQTPHEMTYTKRLILDKGVGLLVESFSSLARIKTSN